MAVTATATGKIVFVQWTGTGRALVLGRPRSPWSGGLVGMAICAYLAPIYMTVRTKGELRDDFRRTGNDRRAGARHPDHSGDSRCHGSMPPLFADRLLNSWAVLLCPWPLISGITTLVLLWRRRFSLAQIAAAATVTLTITGFAAAMYPGSPYRPAFPGCGGSAPGHALCIFLGASVRHRHSRAVAAVPLLDVSRRAESGLPSGYS